MMSASGWITGGCSWHRGATRQPQGHVQPHQGVTGGRHRCPRGAGLVWRRRAFLTRQRITLTTRPDGHIQAREPGDGQITQKRGTLSLRCTALMDGEL